MTEPRVERWRIAPDLDVSRVLTGLWQIADMERGGEAVDPVATAAAMEPYVAAGLTCFDMADHYGSAEVICGRFVEQHGEGVAQLLTKWVPEPGPVTREDVRTAVDRARERMRVDSVDLLQFHAWNYADPSYLDALYYLEELREEGLIRQIGLTNTDTAHLRLVRRSGIEVVSNQICFSLLDQRAADRGMLELCAEEGVTVLAFGTLCGGFLTDRWLGAPEPDWESLETWSQMKYGRFVREAGGWEALQEVLAVAHRVAGRHDVSIANVACRFILEQPGVGGIIVGARLGRSEHVRDTLRLFDFELAPEDHADLRDVVGRLEPIPGDCGDEYRRPPFLTAAGDLSDHLDAMPAPYETEAGAHGLDHVLSGTIWEELAGFSRAVRDGNRVLVSGTTATHRDRVIGGRDAASQACFVIDKIEGALQSVGARLEDVVRTRVYIRNMDDWEPVSRAHGERFGAIRPANTLLRADLIGDEYLVEMEAEARVPNGGGD